MGLLPELPKPWKKIDSKYVDEFVAKFSGFYAFESRPIGWRRVWHCDTTQSEAQDEWPDAEAEQKEFEDGTLKMSLMGSKMDDSKFKSVAFYDDSVERLPLNLEDVSTLPSFIWKLDARELSKYGTYLLANWKQPSGDNAKLPLNNDGGAGVDLEQRRWLASQKWYVYRLRYWKARAKKDILDFLSEYFQKIKGTIFSISRKFAKNGTKVTKSELRFPVLLT